MSEHRTNLHQYGSSHFSKQAEPWAEASYEVKGLLLHFNCIFPLHETVYLMIIGIRYTIT